MQGEGQPTESKDLALGAMRGPPLPHPTLRGAEHAFVVLARVATLQLFEQCDGVELDVDLQQWNDFGVPNPH